MLSPVAPNSRAGIPRTAQPSMPDPDSIAKVMMLSRSALAVWGECQAVSAEVEAYEEWTWKFAHSWAPVPGAAQQSRLAPETEEEDVLSGAAES